MTAREIELLMADYFGVRQNVIVPNVSWGFFLNYRKYGSKYYEADLLVLKPSGYLHEIEIKCTKADIKLDLIKKRHHDSEYVRQLWFAVPKELIADPNIPIRAGILAISLKPGSIKKKKPDIKDYIVETIKSAKVNPIAQPLSIDRQFKLMQLGCMRIWSLKSKNRQLKLKLDT